MSDLANLKPTIRLSIMNPDAESGSLFGRGIASLCLGVRETGSLNAAAKGMGMASARPGASSRTPRRRSTCSC